MKILKNMISPIHTVWLQKRENSPEITLGSKWFFGIKSKAFDNLTLVSYFAFKLLGAIYIFKLWIEIDFNFCIIRINDLVWFAFCFSHRNNIFVVVLKLGIIVREKKQTF